MLKINYKKCTKHAEKVAKTAGDARPVLKGINHDDKGTVTVTDAHRLYQAYNVNAPTNAVLDAVTGEEIDAGNYPDVSRIIPLKDDASHVVTIDDIKAIIKLTKAMQQAGIYDGSTTRKDVNLRIEVIDGRCEIGLVTPESSAVSFYKTFHDVKEYRNGDFTMQVNAQYFIEALEMLADMGAQSADIRLYGKLRPFTMVPVESSDILALICPVRAY